MRDSRSDTPYTSPLILMTYVAPIPPASLKGMTASGPASPTPIIDGDVNIPPFANQSDGLRREPRSPKVTVFLIGVGILRTTA